jgi:hypothetical protein
MVQQMHTVRVMRSDGEVLEFDRSVVAKQLMKVYPGHLVVHCAHVSRASGIGQRSKVTMLRADETLQLGQTYCLLRVPTQRGKNGLLSRSTSMKSIDLDNSSAQEKESIIHYRLPPLPQGAQPQQLFGGPWKPHLDAIVESPLNVTTPSRAHSITMSPLARQAGYVPMSPAQVAPTPRKAEISASSLKATPSTTHSSTS